MDDDVLRVWTRLILSDGLLNTRAFMRCAYCAAFNVIVVGPTYVVLFSVLFTRMESCQCRRVTIVDVPVTLRIASLARLFLCVPQPVVYYVHYFNDTSTY